MQGCAHVAAGGEVVSDACMPALNSLHRSCPGSHTVTDLSPAIWPGKAHGDMGRANSHIDVLQNPPLLVP